MNKNKNKKNKTKKQTPTRTPPQKRREKKNTKMSQITLKWNQGAASTIQISLLQSHHKHALLFKQQQQKVCFETTKRKLVLITF